VQLTIDIHADEPEAYDSLALYEILPQIRSHIFQALDAGPINRPMLRGITRDDGTVIGTWEIQV